MKEKIKSILLSRAPGLLCGLLLIAGTLIQAGTITSGYHFLDDHELLRIEYSLEENKVPFGNVISQWMQNDLNQRFRPLYWVERVVGTAIMGSDMFYWNCYKAVMGVLTFHLLYMAARYLKAKWYTGVLFAGIIMMGAQFTPWYRSANQENTGLFLCALTLYLIGRQYYKEKWGSPVYNISIAVAAILCGLVKESFIFMMPAFAAIKFWLEYSQICAARKERGTLRRLLKRGVLCYIPVLAAFGFNVYYTLFQVGVDNVSYAGFHSDTSIREYISGVLYSVRTYLEWYLVFGVFCIVIVLVCYQVIDLKKWKEYAGWAVIGFGIMAVQLVLHAESGMWERYIIPFIIGYALVYVLLFDRMLQKDAFRELVYTGILMALLFIGVREARSGALQYADDGRLIDGYLTYVVENTDEDSKIIGAFTDGELNLATSCWLEMNGRTKEFYYNWQSGEFSDNVQIVQVNQDTVSWADADVVLCYSADVYTAIDMMGLTQEDVYERLQYGKYAVVVRGKEQG